MSVIVYPISTLIFTAQLKGKAVNTVSPWRPFNLDYQLWASTPLPAPEKPPELIQRGCSEEELRARREGKQRLSCHGRTQERNFSPFSFIKCKRRGSCWAKCSSWDASTVGFNYVLWLKRGSRWQGEGSAKGGEVWEWEPLRGSAPSTLGRHVSLSVRQGVWAAGGLCQGNQWGGPRGRCHREQAAQFILQRLSLLCTNQCTRNKGSSAHRLPKIRCVPTQAIQPWCKHCLWPSGTGNSSSEAATVYF